MTPRKDWDMWLHKLSWWRRSGVGSIGSSPIVTQTNYNVDVLRELVDTLERQRCMAR